MRKQVRAAVVAGVVVLGLVGTLAWAAGSLSVNIPFSFFVKDKEMPAGTYSIQPEGNSESRLVLRGGSGSVVIPVIERLADTGTKEPKVVFDKTEDGKSYLSEVHMPGKDGFLVGISKGREQHVVLTGKE